MKSKSFKKLTEREKKARLVMVLIQKTEGKLSQEKIEKIINSIDINKQYKIKICTNSKEFGLECVLDNIEIAHSWAGGEGILEKSNTIIGNVTYGKNYSYEYFDNGNSEGETTKTTLPDFNIDDVHVILKEKRSWCLWDKQYPKYDNYTNHIVIYVPEGISYEVNDYVKYILDNFNIA